MKIRASSSRSTSRRCRRTLRGVPIVAHTALSDVGSDAATREFSRPPTGEHPTRYRGTRPVSPSAAECPASEAPDDVAGNRNHGRHTPDPGAGEDDLASLSQVGLRQPKAATA